MDLEQAKRKYGYQGTYKILIATKVEATFGPNPCQNLTLINAEGETLNLICDSKRCPDCGPRKQMLLQLQMEATFGDLAHIGRYQSREIMDTHLAAAKKRAQRDHQPFDYQIVGDETLSWLLISNQPVEGTRHMALKDWYRRILNLYHIAAARIRRTVTVGRMSLLPIRRRSGKSGQWTFRPRIGALRDRILNEIIQERDEMTESTGWHVWTEGRQLRSTIDLWRGAADA